MTRIFSILVVISSLISLTLLCFNIPENNYKVPISLKNYTELSLSGDLPLGSPFGSKGLKYTQITTYFNDPSYFIRFGIWHKALDLIPSARYYQDSEAYKQTKLPIIFATCNGSAISAVDPYGANFITIICANTNYKVEFVHESQVFIGTNFIKVRAGEPLGIMGATGKAFGAHVHYAIYQKEGDKYQAIDPLTFLTS